MNTKQFRLGDRVRLTTSTRPYREYIIKSFEEMPYILNPGRAIRAWMEPTDNPGILLWADISNLTLLSRRYITSSIRIVI